MTKVPFKLRPLRPGDKVSISKHANNKKIWQGVRDHFPHPYTEDDARNFIAMTRESIDEIVRAIEVDGEVVGAIGIHPQDDVHRIAAEIGYWLGEAHWGKGIATAAVKEMTKMAFELGYSRVFATVFSNNPGSERVLVKAGFIREGRMRKAAIKDDTYLDVIMYGITDEDVS